MALDLSSRNWFLIVSAECLEIFHQFEVGGKDLLPAIRGPVDQRFLGTRKRRRREPVLPLAFELCDCGEQVERHQGKRPRTA